jgi:hypothetical protein
VFPVKFSLGWPILGERQDTRAGERALVFRKLAWEVQAVWEAFREVPLYTEVAERLFHWMRRRSYLSRDGTVVPARNSQPECGGLQELPWEVLSAGEEELLEVLVLLTRA